MKVTYHAAERLLQRVFNMQHYTRRDIRRARKLLQKDLADVVVTGVKRFIPLPSFKEAVAIFMDGTLITIYPKEYIRNRVHGHYTRA